MRKTYYNISKNLNKKNLFKKSFTLELSLNYGSIFKFDQLKSLRYLLVY